MSWVQYQRGDRQGALAPAERGLAIDPRHVGCLNRRGYYLRWMGRWHGSEESLRAALQLDPDNAYTHTSLAWTLWSKAHGRAGGTVLQLWTVSWRPLRESWRHFREALRLDPASDWARAGLADILLRRARSILLPLLAALIFTTMWLVSAAADAPRSADRGAPPPDPLLTGRLLLMFGFITLLFSGGPACMVVRWSRLGAAVLSPAQRRTAIATAVCLAAAAVAGLACLLTPPPSAYAAEFLVLTLIGPLTAVCEATPGPTRKRLIGYLALFAAAGLAALAIIVRDQLEARRDGAATPLVYLLVLGSWASRLVSRELEKKFGKKAVSP